MIHLHRMVYLASASLIAVLVLSLQIEDACAGSLNEEESAMVRWIEENTAGAESLIVELANINSGTLNRQGVLAVGAILEAELKALGLKTHWLALPENMQRAGHLVARQMGSRGKKILMIGHLDTVFEADDAFQQVRREGNWLHGPGVEDMKAGDVVMLYAVKALRQVGALADAQLVLYYTGDEESPGSPLARTRSDLIEQGKWADIALGFESAMRDDEANWATVSRRGASEWLLQVEGKQAHSSGIFTEDTGAGAIFEAARILTEFYREVRSEQYLTFNAGSILGGTSVEYDVENTRGSAFGKTNVVPNRAVVHGGIRTLSPQQLQRAQDAMRAVVSAHLPHTSASIEFTEGYPPMAPTAGNIALQGMLSSINIELGGDAMPALDPSRRGAADISFVAPYVDGLAGLGAYGEDGHTPNERLDLDSLALAIKRAAILIYRLSRENS